MYYEDVIMTKVYSDGTADLIKYKADSSYEQEKAVHTNLYKLQKEGISGFNFDINPNGSVWYNCIRYKSIEDLLSGKRDTKSEAEIESFIDQIKLLLSASSNNGILEQGNIYIEGISNELGYSKIYMIYGMEGNDLKIFIPKDFGNEVGEQIENSVEIIRRIDAKTTITVIGGSENLKSINGLFKGLDGGKLDVTDLNISNVESADNLFDSTYINRVSVDWLGNSNITIATRMFRYFSAPVLNLGDLELNNLKSAAYCFEGCKSKLIGKMSSYRLENAAGMFESFGREGLKQDISWLDVSNVKAATRMFNSTKTEIVGLGKLDFCSLLDAYEMFSKYKAKELEVRISNKNLKNFKYMFSKAEIRELHLHMRTYNESGFYKTGAAYCLSEFKGRIYLYENAYINVSEPRLEEMYTIEKLKETCEKYNIEYEIVEEDD